MQAKQVIKSKTVDFNAIVVALFAIAKGMGYEVPAEVITGVLAIGNFILRLITKGPISEK